MKAMHKLHNLNLITSFHFVVIQQNEDGSGDKNDDNDHFDSQKILVWL